MYLQKWYVLKRLCFLFLLLTSCKNEPFPIEFATSPKILRGTWLGEANVDTTPTLRLELTAIYVNETTYNVTGTIQFGTNPPSLINGRTFTQNIKYIQPQTTLPDPSEVFLADIKDGNGQIVQQLCVKYTGRVGIYDFTYTGFLGNPNSFGRLPDDRPICDDGTNTGKQPIVLRKSP